MTALPSPRPERGAPRPTGTVSRPSLRPVPPRRRRLSTIPFVMVVAVVLAAGMVGLLVLTTAIQDQTFSVQAKQAEAERLADQLAALEAEAAEARSVQGLAVAAQKLGMRPDPYGTQLVLPDGDVVGKQRVVTGGEIPSVRYLTPEQAKAQIDALAKAEAARKARQQAARAAAKKKAAAAKAKAKAAAEAKKQSAQPQEDQ